MEDMNNQEIEKLSLAIVNAIIKSEDVQKVLAELKKEELICHEGLMVLMIRMNALTSAAEELRDIAKEIKNKKSKDQFIDGKKLSSKEVAFQEYCLQTFDEQQWLKDIKISFTS